MPKDNVVQLYPRQVAVAARGQFIELIKNDINENPDDIVPLPRDLLKRMRTLVEKADQSRQAELLEG